MPRPGNYTPANEDPVGPLMDTQTLASNEMLIMLIVVAQYDVKQSSLMLLPR